METSLVFIACILLSATQAADWSYKGANGPEYWPDMFATCGGTKQSPVNIVSFEATEDASLENIELSEEYSTTNTGTWLIENNGHSAQVSVTDGDYFISRGGLGAEFRLSQFHFHWGSEDWQGSEHTVDGKKYPMEIHLVHYNTKYANFSEAADKEDGLAVIAFFFEIDSADNAALEPVIEALDYIVNATEAVEIEPMNLIDLMGGNTDELKNFYRYSGSLTTPTCDESVTWTVFEKFLKVSNSQMEKFRSLEDDEMDLLVDNFRPTQPLRGRTIYTSRQNGASHVNISVTCIISTLIFTVIRWSS